MRRIGKMAWLLGAWAAFLALYAAVAHYLGPGAKLSSFGDVVQCFVPLLANAGLLINAGTPHWRRNLFWMLLALSCTMWMVGQFQWTYYEVYLHQEVPGLFAGDIIFYLRGIPLIAALALRPHRQRGELHLGLGYLDFGLLMTWWTFLYVYRGAALDVCHTHAGYLQHQLQHADISAAVPDHDRLRGFAGCARSGAWRTVYFHLFAPTALYTLDSLLTNMAIAQQCLLHRQLV